MSIWNSLPLETRLAIKRFAKVVAYVVLVAVGSYLANLETFEQATVAVRVGIGAAILAAAEKYLSERAVATP